MVPDDPVLTSPRVRWWHVRPALVVAFVVSVALHLAVSLVPDDLAEEAESPPLVATITELPPPPLAVPAPAPPAPVRKPASRPRQAPSLPPPAPSEAATPLGPEPLPAPAPAGKAAPPEAPAPAVATNAPEPPVLAEDVTPPVPTLERKTLPPRVDLAYKVFYGTQGFWIGSATYRFEHADNRYRIATVGEARGLAALLFRGRGRMESRGMITGAGLQPHEFVVDKFNQRGAERAEFDWETGIATLHGDKTAELELPTFDILALMWQFYFRPPEAGTQTFALATTRRVNRFTITRQRGETIEWGNGPVETEVWHRTSNDGRTDAYVWLAPSLRWLPVKMRVVNTARGTVEAVLERIAVDEQASVAESVAGDAPLLPEATSPPEPAPAPRYDPFDGNDHRS